MTWASHVYIGSERTGEALRQCSWKRDVSFVGWYASFQVFFFSFESPNLGNCATF
jgi:hypothetical protein